MCTAESLPQAECFLPKLIDNPSTLTRIYRVFFSFEPKYSADSSRLEPIHFACYGNSGLKYAAGHWLNPTFG